MGKYLGEGEAWSPIATADFDGSDCGRCNGEVVRSEDEWTLLASELFLHYILTVQAGLLLYTVRQR